MVVECQIKMVDPQNIIKKGYLTKSPPLKKVTSRAKRWCRRWFVLYDPSVSGDTKGKLVLYYFTDQESMSKKETPKEIDLSQCQDIVDRKGVIHGFGHVLDVVIPKRTFHLCAESKKEKDEWLQTLKLRVFNEFTMLPENSRLEGYDGIGLQGSLSGLSPQEEFVKKLETLKRVSGSSTASSGDDSARTSSVFEDSQLYSAMNCGVINEEMLHANDNTSPPRSPRIIRSSNISTGSNTSTDDGIVVTPRHDRWSWGQASVSSDTSADCDRRRKSSDGFTGPKLVRESHSFKSSSPPQVMYKCKSMFNLSENLTRLATEYDQRTFRPTSDSGTLSRTRLNVHRGSRCASLLEEFKQIARTSMAADSTNDTDRRISDVIEEPNGGVETRLVGY